MYNWYKNIFHAFAVLDSISCSEQKKLKKTRLKQRSKTKEGKSKRCCRRQSTWLIIALLSNRYRSAVAPISLRCCSVVALLLQRYRTVTVPLSLHRCHSIVALLLHRYRSSIARYRSAAVAPAVAMQSQRYCTAVAPLSNRNS